MKNFELSGKEEKAAEDFIKVQMKKDNTMPTAGERWSYIVTPTGIGTVWKIKDELLNEIKDITDWDCW